MSNVKIQRRSGLHQRYAPAVVVQRLHVPGSQEGGCRCPESDRRTSLFGNKVRTLLMTQQNLQSAEEMEEEERAAQSAKLQELIRRGGPSDLQEANRLMKVMAGFDTRHKTDYRAKAAEEVVKVQQKAKLLEDMLQNHKAGDRVGEGDVFEVSERPPVQLESELTPAGTCKCSAKCTSENTENVRRGVR